MTRETLLYIPSLIPCTLAALKTSSEKSDTFDSTSNKTKLEDWPEWNKKVFYSSASITPNKITISPS